MQQIFSRLLRLRRTATRSNSSPGCTAQRPAHCPQHALLHARSPGREAFNAAVRFFALFKALKLTEHHNNSAVTYMHFMFKHISEHLTVENVRRLHLPTPTPPHPHPPLALAYRLNAFRLIFCCGQERGTRVPVHPSPLRHRAACFPEEWTRGGEKKKPPLILTGDRLVRH